jgi:hypothetical protein
MEDLGGAQDHQPDAKRAEGECATRVEPHHKRRRVLAAVHSAAVAVAGDE